MQPRITSFWSPIGRTETHQDYYVSRPAAAPTGDYWGTIIDPDGNMRDRMSEAERVQYLEDRREELEFIRNLEPGAICDVGCGPGWLLSELPNGWLKIGVEIDPRAIEECQTQGIHTYPVIDCLKETFFDVVVAYHVIEHMADPIHQIGTIHERLKPGGWLILGTPDFGSPCAVRFGDKYRMLHDPTHISLFTCESMHRFLRDHGFTIHDVRFPFPARYATAENFLRWNDMTKVSPPWPGNWMTFYAQR